MEIAKGIEAVEHIPGWLFAVMGAAFGGVSTMAVGLVSSLVKSKGINTQDRSDFTQQLMERVQSLETSVTEERVRCDQQIAELSRMHEQRLESRDRIITELRQRITSLEQNWSHHYQDDHK